MASILMIWRLELGNANYSSIIPGAHGFKTSGQNPSNPKLNNLALGKVRQNTVKRAPSGANKLPRAPSGFQIPHKSLKKQGVYAGATGFSGSGSGNPEADSNLNNPHSKSQDQC